MAYLLSLQGEDLTTMPGRSWAPPAKRGYHYYWQSKREPGNNDYQPSLSITNNLDVLRWAL